MKLVILDRDGVINEDSEHYIKSPSEWRPLPGSIEATARLTAAGFTLVVATNQSGVGRGLFSAADLEAMHRKMHDLVKEAGGVIDGIFYCPHTPADGCRCRKPAPGLLDAIARHYGVELTSVPVVGDSLRDLEAAVSRQCTPLLVRTGKGAATEAALKASSDPALAGARVFDDLARCADYLIKARTETP